MVAPCYTRRGERLVGFNHADDAALAYVRYGYPSLHEPDGARGRRLTPPCG
jgi:hypothetical protein